MKQLTRIRLINWHLFENTTVTCQGTTYFIGVNGVGKSTILDAVQFALVGGQREVKFNQAAMAGSQRTLTSYVRGELGAEGQRFLRGDATAVVALEFRNPDNSYFVHGAVIDAYQDGRSPDVTYFIVNGAPLNDNWFFRTEGQLFDSRAFRRHLEHFALPDPQARAQLFTRLEDYRFHLLNRLGQLKETFTAKIVKGLAFSPLTNIRDFAHNYLLDENLVDVKTLREQLETMRHFESLAADIRQRIESLNQIEEQDQERRTQRRLRLTNGYLRRYAQSDAYLADLKKFRLERDEKTIQLSRLELQREALSEQFQHATNALIEAQIALRTDATAARDKALREEIAQLEAELSTLRQQETLLQQTLAREHADAQRLQTFLLADGLEIPTSLQDFVNEDASRFTPHASRFTPHASRLSHLQTDLQTLGHTYAEQMALLQNESRQLRQEAEQLQQEIHKLRTGDRAVGYDTAAPESSRLRRLLRAELGLSADEVIPLYEALRVPDEAWQNAVEGILGRTRFDLLVPPEHYDAAMRLYRQRREKDNLHGVGLPDADRILKNARLPLPNSLAIEVETTHPAARAFVDLLLGGYVKCDTLEDLRDHRTAVTRDCFVRRNFTSSHMDPRHYQRWFIGERATPRQIEQREEQLTVIGRKLAELQTRDTALRERLALTRDKVLGYVELARDLDLLAHRPERETRLAACRTELAGLDTQSLTTLQAQVQTCQAEVDRLQKAVETSGESIGGLKNRLDTLTQEFLPGLERQADEAVQEARAFLVLEEAEELLEDLQKEYERRRQRQPLETVLENATRYESDYQNAETRSRDRLREAKQRYSLTYQFGYDGDEDAARYVRERDRYVESELPQYEARIAEQRAMAEHELVENFIHRLREQIEDARQQLGYLNTTLSALRFGGERFEFITRPEPSLRQVYDMIMDSQAILGESLFESGFRQRHQAGWDLLFERLTAGPDEALTELRELQDYRNYLQYDIRIHYPNGDRALLSQINAKKSGGETTTPFYVAMAASFAQAYRLNQPRPSDTIRLALFDEAFGKMDTARTASALQFMVDNQLQVLLATPPDKAAGLLPHVNAVRTVVRQNNHAFVIEIDKTEMLKELEEGIKTKNKELVS
ncbi:MAG: AAA family ATPase [Anaerolineales bacterium]|nr:AAA family ATPase [Anaerolineales bacterium]